MIISEDIWSKNAEDKEETVEFGSVAKIRNLQISQVANFSNLRNFAGCEISQHYSPASRLLFDPLFLALYKYALYVILVPAYIFVISLVLSTYISSVKLVTSIKLAVHQSLNKNWRQISSPSAVCDFLALSSTFLPFLGSQTHLDDEKSSDAWLNPPHP